MSGRALKQIRKTLEKMQKHESDLRNLETVLKGLEPSVDSVSAAIDSMKTGPLIWNLINTKTNEFPCKKFKDSTSPDSLLYAPPFSIIFQQLVDKVNTAHTLDRGMFEVELTCVPVKEADLLDRRKNWNNEWRTQKYEHVGSSVDEFYDFDPLPEFWVAEMLIDHVPMTKEINQILVQLDREVSTASEIANAFRRCENGEESCGNGNDCDCYGDIKNFMPTVMGTVDHLLWLIVESPAFDTLRPLIVEGTKGRETEIKNFRMTMIASEEDEQKRAISEAKREAAEQKFLAEKYEKDKKTAEEALKRAQDNLSQIQSKKRKS